MTDRNPDVPQSDDATLVSDLIRLLRIVGPLGRLRVADIVVPVVNMGDVVTRSITAMQPVFREGDVFTAGVQTAAPANTTHATTGALPAGTYDVQFYVSPHTSEAHIWEIRYITPIPAITTWSVVVPIDGPGFYQTIAFELVDDATLQIRNTTVFGAGVQSVATIFARIRT